MQSANWITLFRRIPPAQHDNLTLMLINGTEISVQSLLRLEDDFVLLKGRLGGTTDAGRMLVVPFDQMTYLTFTRAIKESEVQAIFGELEQPAAANGTAETQVMGAPEGQPAEPALPPGSAPTPVPAGTPMPLQGRPNLVERLRNRASGSKQGK